MPLLVCSALVCAQMNTSALCARTAALALLNKGELQANRRVPYLIQMQQIVLAQKSALELDDLAHAERGSHICKLLQIALAKHRMCLTGND